MGCFGEDIDPNKPVQKGGSDDITNGPVKTRGCTDAFCIPIFIAAQVLFVILTIAGLNQGDVGKLYKPRDFSGAYCGVEENWNNGPKTLSQPKLSYTMNVTSIIDPMMEQLICSTAATEVLKSSLSGADLNEYLCACCKIPCSSCDSALDLGKELTDANVVEIMSAKTSAFQGMSNYSEIFSFGGLFGGKFSTTNFWSAPSHLNQVCLPSCAITAESTRNYSYRPSQDSRFLRYWEELSQKPSGIQTVIENKFVFPALDFETCPYDADRCVVFPGIAIKDAVSDYCLVDMDSKVVSVLGDATSQVLDGVTEQVFSPQPDAETLGALFGDLMEAIDVLILVCFFAFITGLVWLMLIRFLGTCCVWSAILLSVLAFFLVGWLLFERGHQCKGDSLFKSSKQTATAIAGIATTIGKVDAPSEERKGDGHSEYRGHQQRTRDGFACANWDEQDALPQFNSTNYPDSGLEKNYCRNPFEENATEKASTIWCVTNDPEQVWGVCSPIGVIKLPCERGYAVESRIARDVLHYCAIVVWVLGGVFVISLCCLRSRINLAIILNKVACMFIHQNPHSLLIPITQIVVGILWLLIWLYSAAFLLSQVPDDTVPTGAFATYSEAIGTSSDCPFWQTGPECEEIPGKCTDKWPVGGVWKDMNCTVSAEGVAECWRCSPPRYALDLRFAASFFVFLWNNAFNVALGQITISMCVGLWFFSPGAIFVFSGIRTVFRYHLGTVALGSFIVACVQFARYVFKYLEENAKANRNKMFVVICKIIDCVLWCFEKILGFLNKNAYIQTALMGTNFCVSAKKAFFLIARNAVRFGIVVTLSSIVQIIGLCTIIIVSVFLGMTTLEELHPDISNSVPLAVVFVIIAWMVGQLYSNVLKLTVDTSLQCFIIAEEMGLQERDVGSTAFRMVVTCMSKVKERAETQGSHI